MSVASSEREVARVLFLIVTEADRLKMDAVSNVSPTGGGARDLRFSPESSFLPFFKKLLPKVVVKPRGTTEIETYVGRVFWEEGGRERSRRMEVWPPTSARPNECRIARVHEFGFSRLVRRDPRGGRAIVMLFQLRNGIVRVHFTTETSLRVENWNSIIRDFAVKWLATRHKYAFIDLETTERFPGD